MVRVLHELAHLDGGGVARLLYEYYRYMDHDKVTFDFIINNDIDDGILEQPLEQMGCRIYRLDPLKRNLFSRLRSLKKIIKEGHYDAVHAHLAVRSCFILHYAKKYGVKMRIAHSHTAYETISSLKLKFDHTLTAISQRQATHLFACGMDAGKYIWGEKAVKNGRVHIMRNAVDTEKFMFREPERRSVRAELGAEDKLIIGTVGRLHEQKNYSFLLNVFQKVLLKRPDAILVMVGRGNLEAELKNKAREWKIDSNVKFLGVRSDVDRLLNAFDLFVLPSLYEGLPVVLVEAQANGLPEVVSDKVTKEAEITDLIEFMPLTAREEEWAEQLISQAEKRKDRKKYAEIVREAGYDIQCESRKMQEFYLTSVTEQCGSQFNRN